MGDLQIFFQKVIKICKKTIAVLIIALQPFHTISEYYMKPPEMEML